MPLPLCNSSSNNSTPSLAVCLGTNNQPSNQRLIGRQLFTTICVHLLIILCAHLRFTPARVGFGSLPRASCIKPSPPHVFLPLFGILGARAPQHSFWPFGSIIIHLQFCTDDYGLRRNLISISKGILPADFIKVGRCLCLCRRVCMCE